MLKLIMGCRRFSSWSMRPWVLMKQLGIDFEAVVVPYARADWAAAVREFHPAGTVPVLVADGMVVGDSLAIVETLAELFPHRGVWPAVPVLRARARSLCAEMHASFGALRQECSFDVFRGGPARPLSERAAIQLARADAIFAAADSGGFLCGAFSAADAFYVPVALRVLQYGLMVSPRARTYVERVAVLAPVRTWLAEAEQERDWPAVMPGGSRPYHREIVTGDDAWRMAEQWIAAWNACDLDMVLTMFAEDAAFVSPKAESILGHGRVEGRAGLRRYWTTALQRIPRLAFKLEAVDWDAESSALLVVYQADLAGTRTRAAERWLLDASGRIRYGEAYFGAGF